MIRVLRFEPSLARVRRALLQPSVTLTIDAACTIADGLASTLGAVLHAPCELSLGEPVALEPAVWRAVAARAFACVLPARHADLVMLLPHADARGLISAAFREAPGVDGAWSPLEAAALQRILARALEPAHRVIGEPRGPLRIEESAALPLCVEYVDVRVAAPLRMTVGLALTRPLPEPRPARTLDRAVLGEVAAPLRAILGRTAVPAARLLALRTGDVVPFVTKVDGNGELNCADQRIAFGTCGVVQSRAAFQVQSFGMRGKGS